MVTQYKQFKSSLQKFRLDFQEKNCAWWIVKQSSGVEVARKSLDSWQQGFWSWQKAVTNMQMTFWSTVLMQSSWLVFFLRCHTLQSFAITPLLFLTFVSLMHLPVVMLWNHSCTWVLPSFNHSGTRNFRFMTGVESCYLHTKWQSQVKDKTWALIQ